MSNIVDTVEERIQNAYLTAIGSIVAPKIELLHLETTMYYMYQT